MKKLILILCLSILPAHALESCVLSTDGKMTDISIEHNDIIDVCPIYTIKNEKNLLLVQPLKVGNTRFCILKDGKQKVMFNVEVQENSTKIGEVDGFEIFTIDTPPQINNEFEFELDLPPMLQEEPLIPEGLKGIKG